MRRQESGRARLLRHHHSSTEPRLEQWKIIAVTKVRNPKISHDKGSSRRSLPTSTKKSEALKSQRYYTKNLVVTRDLNTSKRKSVEDHGLECGHQTSEANLDQECSLMTQESIHQAQARYSEGVAEQVINPIAEFQAPEDFRTKPSTSSTSEMLQPERTRHMSRSQCTRSHQLMTGKSRGDRL